MGLRGGGLILNTDGKVYGAFVPAAHAADIVAISADCAANLNVQHADGFALTVKDSGKFLDRGKESNAADCAGAGVPFRVRFSDDIVLSLNNSIFGAVTQTFGTNRHYCVLRFAAYVKNDRLSLNANRRFCR